MQVDSFLKIGHSHTMCQDYILSGTDPIPYIILADGCSSAADSDIGARLLCHAALSYLMNNSERLDTIDWETLGDVTIRKSWATLITHFPTLDIECLDATLIVAYKYKGYYKVFIYGDGHFYYVSPDGQQCYYKVDFIPNAPAYLRYQLKGKQQYIDNNVQMSVKAYDWINTANAISPFTPLMFTIPEEHVKTLVVASDGIDSIMFKDEELYKTKYLKLYAAVQHFKMRPNIIDCKYSVDFNYNNADLIPKVKELNFLDLFNDMTNFKLTEGAFLKRRVKKVIKEHLKNGFVNDDDMSIGCFLED
jgi:hypothetical protein